MATQPLSGRLPVGSYPPLAAAAAGDPLLSSYTGDSIGSAPPTDEKTSRSAASLGISISPVIPGPASPANSPAPSLTSSVTGEPRISVPTSKLPVHTPTGEKAVDSTAEKVWRKTRRIFQRFLIRNPHALGAAGAVWLTYEYLLPYVLKDENRANDAALFVLTAGTTYSLFRAICLEIIPEWMLPREPKYNKWRQGIYISYTIFFTLSLTSAVWKLNIGAVHGLALWAISFGAPYRKLSSYYPDIDQNPQWQQQDG